MTAVANRPTREYSPIAQVIQIAVTGNGPDGKTTHRWLAEVVEGEWKLAGACWGTDTEAFFPTRETTLNAKDGKLICDGCGVKVECLAYAVFTNQQVGTWGGESPEVRRSVRRRLGLVGE